jgi:hypothetical protein
MIGLDAALEVHRQNEALHKESALAHDAPPWQKRLAARDHPSQWRHSASKERPRFAFVEQAVVLTLMQRSDDAIRVYCTMALFANAKSGLAYPSQRTLARKLGGVPYHSDFNSGRTRVGLTKKQRATRQKQIDRFNLRVVAAIDELCCAQLMVRNTGTRRMSSDLSVTFLAQDGQQRKLGRLQRRHGFLMIPAGLYETGALGLWHGHRKRQFRPLEGLELRVLLLGLRDRDRLEFGGVDPRAASGGPGGLRLGPFRWPLELGCTPHECETAVRALLRKKLFTLNDRIVSTIDSHYIRADANPTAPDEMYVEGLDIPHFTRHHW